MKRLLLKLSFLWIIIQLGACSMAELTVKASMPMIEGGMIALNRETDLPLAKAAMPANIELMEGMIVNSPDNDNLRNYAAQAYYGYAFGFVEDEDPQRAARFYRRGLNHALYNLHQSGLKQEILSGNLDTLQKKLSHFDEDDVPALFWAASNWAKWIDHNRNRAEAIADLPRAVMLMQRVLELDEKFFMAGPNIFFAVYYGSRSPMLGGNYTLSEQHFERAKTINKHQLLLVDLLQAQYLDRQQFEQENFHKRLTGIIEKDVSAHIDIALINQIAKDKARKLLKKESQWF
ncbi:hypothetical protein MNBD_GAMMA11-456 [hydrothermal vent metagenome]|uniref:TRAP transporter TatT component family protein n=1 Tax=hydrothermal vent metagenome TaxID=652676 RepID=A0A3B0X7Y2_9ZZZZ